MKRFLVFSGICALLDTLICLLPLLSLADTNLDVNFVGNLLDDDDWHYIGHTYSGVTFAIPEESYQEQLTDEMRENGFIFMLWNDDYSLVLRRFTPDELTFLQFRRMLLRVRTAKLSERKEDDVRILSYRNMKPSVDQELYGIALTGTDGNLYKISIFTGDSLAYDEAAPVWKIAEIIDKSTRIQDFSEWGVTTPSRETNDGASSP